MAAIYQADIFCDGCADEIRERLWLESEDYNIYVTIDEWEEANGYDDEWSYDSDEYPKRCSDDEESDSPQHCGGHEGCVNAEVLSDGTKVGYCFGNDLTSDGIDYLREAVADDVCNGDLDSVAVEIWMDRYSWVDFGGIGNCEGCGKLAACCDEGFCADCNDALDAEADCAGIDPCLGCPALNGCAGCEVAIDGC